MGRSGDLESKNDKIIEKLLKDDKFKINRDGQIFSKLTENGQGISDKWREVGTENSEGYLRFRYDNAFLLVHRVVFRKYNGKLESDMTINHKNGDKSVNKPENLEQVPHVENNIHKWKMKKKSILAKVLVKIAEKTPFDYILNILPKEKKAKTWSKEEILVKIMENDVWLERAVLAIYKLQTEDEKKDAYTKVKNSIGFNGVDASFGTSLAKQIESGKALTYKQKEYLRKMMKKYVGQLEKIANKKIAA